MSFLTGKMESVQRTDPQAMGLKQLTLGRLEGIDPFTGLDRGGGGIPPALMQLFQSSLDPVLAQAKESAGNLTGSGLGNIIGGTAGRSLSDFLTHILSQRASNATSLTGQLLTPQTQGYKPGFLDSLFQGVGAAAPFLAAA